MPFVLEPHVAGEFGVLDIPEVDDLIGSFPRFLVSAVLAARLADGDFAGFSLHSATVKAGPDYGDAPVPTFRQLVPEPGVADPDAWIADDHRLCVSDRLMAVLRGFELPNCDVTPL